MRGEGKRGQEKGGHGNRSRECEGGERKFRE